MNSDVKKKNRIIVITSGKGGVGKTTTTANIGTSLARFGYKVALLDSDIGLRNLDLLLGLENRILYTAMDVINGECRLDQALVRDKRYKNLAFMAISKTGLKYNVTRNNMQNLVESLDALGFEFILIDCPAGIDVGFINAISTASEAILVTTPDITAIRDADRVTAILEANGIYDIKLLVNRVRNEMVKKGEMMSVIDIQEMLGLPLLGVIPEDKRVIISTNKGEPVVMGNDLPLSPEKVGVILAGRGFEFATQRLVNNDNLSNSKLSEQEVGEVDKHSLLLGSRVLKKFTQLWDSNSDESNVYTNETDKF
jgi:septum site-determining protein MinD|uniref:Putative septum site-determining protein MinD n=1 Tax=Pseudochloris wilhelmii TaxID=1418016 RepID=A0A097KQP5_9CHLO|nr:septum site-determining protein [Pseudochloris wilhelmii]AIT95490.1 septum site-determining protein [Pseudochloris wilhelmii]